MPITLANVSYSKIEKYVKGIALMSRGSINFLKAAYGGELEKASKLLANYSWRYTRDTTLVLITAAVLVLAEKSTKAHLEIQQAVDDLDNNMVKKLFIAMAKGSSVQAKANVNCLENVFKAVLNGGDMKTKADDAWKKFETYISKIKPWKHSTTAVVDYVKPILKASLEQSLYSSFKNNLLLGEEDQKEDDLFRKITDPLFGIKGSCINIGGKNFYLFYYEEQNKAADEEQNKAADTVKIKHDGINIHYKYDNGNGYVYVSKPQLQLIIKRHKPDSSKKLEKFLVKHLSSLFKEKYKTLDRVISNIRKQLKKYALPTSEITSPQITDVQLDKIDNDTGPRPPLNTIGDIEARVEKVTDKKGKSFYIAKFDTEGALIALCRSKTAGDFEQSLYNAICAENDDLVGVNFRIIEQ